MKSEKGMDVAVLVGRAIAAIETGKWKSLPALAWRLRC
jgi:hypothetical protein